MVWNVKKIRLGAAPPPSPEGTIGAAPCAGTA